MGHTYIQVNHFASKLQSTNQSCIYVSFTFPKNIERNSFSTNEKNYATCLKTSDPLKNFDRLINEQIKEDKKHNLIPPFLQNLDSLAQHNCEAHRFRAKQNFNRIFYPSSQCSVIIRKRQAHSDLADYLHAACFGPVKSTFIKSIKKGFF